MVEHYRVSRHTGNWLSPSGDEKLSDFITVPTILHAHSRDAAQQGLNTRYPHKRKLWRTTV